jgi:hypothetical protein
MPQVSGCLERVESSDFGAFKRGACHQATVGEHKRIDLPGRGARIKIAVRTDFQDRNASPPADQPSLLRNRLSDSSVMNQVAPQPARPTPVVNRRTKRHAIDAGVDSTLQRLYSAANGSRELVRKAHGVLIFPSVIDAGLVVGGRYGEGSLRIGGRTVGYYSTATGSVGWQIGAQSRAIIFLARSSPSDPMMLSTLPQNG